MLMPSCKPPRGRHPALGFQRSSMKLRPVRLSGAGAEPCKGESVRRHVYTYLFVPQVAGRRVGRLGGNMPRKGIAQT